MFQPREVAGGGDIAYGKLYNVVVTVQVTFKWSKVKRNNLWRVEEVSQKR